jgi:hypothetical protein
MAYVRRPLTGSVNGRGVKVAAIATPGTTIHTAQSSATLVDVLTLYAYNSDVQGRTLTIEFGGVTAPDDNIVVDLPPKGSGMIPVVVDLPIRNSLVVRAFCETANVAVIFGYSNTES